METGTIGQWIAAISFLCISVWFVYSIKKQNKEYKDIFNFAPGEKRNN